MNAITHARQDHFTIRCQERGITQTNISSIHRSLWSQINGRPYRQRDHTAQLLGLVKKLDSGARLFRFEVPEGIFYVVASNDGRPITMLTHEMVRRYKAVGKVRRRYRDKTRRPI